jgi:hypothetical protein
MPSWDLPLPPWRELGGIHFLPSYVELSVPGSCILFFLAWPCPCGIAQPLAEKKKVCVWEEGVRNLHIHTGV